MAAAAELIRLVHDGVVGTPRMVAMREHRFPFLVKVGNWNRFTENTGGTLVEKTCHFFDLMNVILQERPWRVMASGAQDVNHLDETYDGRTPDILDNAFVIVDYPSGARALLDLCMFAEATHHQEELSVVGERGKVEALIPSNIVRVGRRGEHWIGGVEEYVAPRSARAATRACTTARATSNTSCSPRRSGRAAGRRHPRRRVLGGRDGRGRPPQHRARPPGRTVEVMDPAIAQQA